MHILTTAPISAAAAAVTLVSSGNCQLSVLAPKATGPVLLQNAGYPLSKVHYALRSWHLHAETTQQVLCTAHGGACEFMSSSWTSGEGTTEA